MAFDPNVGSLGTYGELYLGMTPEEVAASANKQGFNFEEGSTGTYADQLAKQNQPVAVAAKPKNTLPGAGIFSRAASMLDGFKLKSKGGYGDALRSAANVPVDATQFALNAAEGLNPMSSVPRIIDNAKELIAGVPALLGEQKGLSGKEKVRIAGEAAVDTAEAAYHMLVPQFFQQLIAGDVEGAQKTITEKPAATILPVFLTARAAAQKAGYGQQFDKLVSDVASPAIKVGTKVVDMAKEVVKNTSSVATGLSQDTIETVVQDPKKFSEMQKEGADRQDLSTKVGELIHKRRDELSGTGKEYKAIRESGGAVKVPKGMVQDVLKKYGLELDDDGQILTTDESVPLSGGDKSAIQGFIDQYGSKDKLSNNAFLNTRKSLDNMSNWDASKTDISNTVARDLRTAYDALGKKQISGLETLDAEYAPEITFLNKIRKEYMNPDGSLKDGAASKIVNSIGKGKTLDRLEELSPGITQDIKIVKALENIKLNSSAKAGNYVHAAGAIGALYTGNIPAAIGLFLTTPSIFVRLLKAYGTAQNIDVSAIIDKVTQGKPPTAAEAAIIAGAATANQQEKK